MTCIPGSFEYRAGDGTWNSTNLAFPGEDSPYLTYIGTYESGTLLNETGEVIDGKLRTEILNDVTKVYWLVETRAPIGGYVMVPGEGTVAFLPVSQDEIDGNGITGDGCKVTSYKSGLKDHPVENYKMFGPGPEYYSALKLNKWLETTDSSGNTVYEPLGNVRFQLTITGYSGFVMDELVTGLENDLTIGETDGFRLERLL